MELVKNIFFNTDKIIENSEIKITYAGVLFQNGAEHVEVHLGYDENWENPQDIDMEKTELGFQAVVQIKEANKLNLCFKNSNGEWDNNDGNNYYFTVEKQEQQENTAKDQNVSEVPTVVYKTPSWGELITKTFNNFVNYISKLFGNKEENKNQ